MPDRKSARPVIISPRLGREAAKVNDPRLLRLPAIRSHDQFDTNDRMVLFMDAADIVARGLADGLRGGAGHDRRDGLPRRAAGLAVVPADAARFCRGIIRNRIRLCRLIHGPDQRHACREIHSRSHRHLIPRRGSHA